MTVLKDTRLMAVPLINALKELPDLSGAGNSTINNGAEDVPAYLVSAQLIDSMADIQKYILDTNYYTYEELGLRAP